MEAVAIRGDRIVATGTSSEVMGFAGPSTRQVDLAGRAVIPGFNDAHAHIGAPLPGVAFRTSESTNPDPSLGVVLDSLRALVRRIPVGTWLRTDIDAAMLDDPRARRYALDSVTPRHPVWLGANTGHGVILNSAALRSLGIGNAPRDPPGGFYERAGVSHPGRDRHQITGLLHEYAGWSASQRLRSSQPDSVLLQHMRRYGERAASLGITSVQNIAITYDAATTLRIQRLAPLPQRVRVVPMRGTSMATHRADDWVRAVSRSGMQRGSHLRISGVKWILDGTGIERLSMLRRPYTDRPGWHGRLNFSPDTLRSFLRGALAAREQPIMHAIGDSTIAVVLSIMESLAPDSAWRRLRPRLEHAEWLTPDLASRAGRLGVIVVENPTHFTDPPELVAARFGAERSKSYQPFASLRAAGVQIAIGSDGPVNPFVNLLYATTHPANPAEALTREQALIAYTHGSAFAEHEEHRKGVIAPGMLADLAVLSQDIFKVGYDQLAETTSVLTIIGGVVVHDVLTPAGVGPPRRK